MSITVVFDPPLPSDNPATFNSKAFTLLGDLNEWSTEANALASDVSTKQSTASAAANTASTAAGTATTQAGIATTAANNASNSEAAALASANSAAASFDAFDDRYLGAKTGDPTLDNDGNALLTGALYWNTGSSVMRVYSGTAWNDAAQGTSTPTQTFSGTGAQTAFTLSGTPGSLGSLEVFISGVRQVPTTTYTVSGTTLTFVTAPPAGTGNIFVRWISTQPINVPADGSVTQAKLDAAFDATLVKTAGNQTIAGVKTFSSFPVLPSITGGFYKSDSSTVAFTKTGNGTASIKAGTLVDVAGKWVQFATATAITMPTLTAGTDYAIWVKDDGTIQADASFTVAPGTGNWRKIGGFHYAPGGNATGTSGGNTTPQINEYSFWDLKFRPDCSDPRGMTLVAGGFWVDIYLTGVDAITNGSSKYNVTMADGSSPPKVPTMFGGNGSTTYGTYTWFEAQELATAFGKRTLTQQEFMAAAYGTTEASSIGTDQVSTVLNAAYTSKWGVIQATGVLWVWGLDRGGPFAAASWNANTEGRGSEYNAPNASLLGGSWNGGSNSGSRCSGWNSAASDADSAIGSRFACDHLQLD